MSCACEVLGERRYGAFVDEPDSHKPNSRGGSVSLSRQCVIGNEASLCRRASAARFCA